MAYRDSVVASLSLRRPRPHGVIPELDTDVMEAICSSMDDMHDLLSVSLTCSVMWRIAIRQLLRKHTIRLNTRKAIRGFRDFILNQRPTRAPHIHSLAVTESAWAFSESDTIDAEDHLMDILECAVNLDALSLYLHLRYTQLTRVISAFAGMRAVRYLSLEDPQLRWAQDALGALRCTPRTLRLSKGGKGAFASDPPAASFSQLFSRFSGSSALTSLHLDCIPMYDNSFLGLPPFRSVRSLTIIKPLEREPKLDSLLHLFPSLDGSLSLRLDTWKSMRLAADSRRVAEALEGNRRSQEVSRWTKLDRLDCDSLTARMLGLQCPVRQCTLDTFDTCAIADIRPQHLVIASLCLPSYIAPISHATRTLVSSAAAASAESHPTHIVLILSCTQSDFFSASNILLNNSNIRWEVVFDHLQQILSIFKNATHVRLVFHWHKLERDSVWGAEADQAAVHRLISEMRGPAFVSRLSPSPSLLAACPKLRCFFVTVAGRDDTHSAMQGRWIQDRAWRVLEFVGLGEEGFGGANGKTAPPMIEELSDYTAERIIEAEDLGLPEEWEQKLAFCRG